jgi:sterol 3beta-glucosyltransferase
MKIVILTSGTRGDIQPYLALGVGLKHSGHNVQMVGSLDFEAYVKSYELDFYPLQVNMADIMKTEEVQTVLEAGNPLKGLLLQHRITRQSSKKDTMQNDIWNACQDAEAIIYHPGLANGYFIALHLGIPCVMASPIPMSPTKVYPSLLFYRGPRLGKIYNLFTHYLFEQVFWQMSGSSIKAFWREMGKESIVNNRPPYRDQRNEGFPILYGYSNYVLPRPYDWNPNLNVTGYWFLDAAADWQPPADLVDFLRSGDPPVYIGFGSMGNKNRAKESTEIALEALSICGRRGVLVSGWNSLSEDIRMPDTVYLIKDVPHSWLFPQMAAVVHHGGAGTTAAGLRAGVPSVIVPHGMDQPMWGQRVAEMGVGAKPIPRKKLTAENLANAITFSLKTDVQNRARELGKRITQENGVARAVELINQYLQAK